MSQTNTHPSARSITDDLTSGISQPHLWMYLAKQDLATQYNRTTLGALWIPLNIFIHVSVLGIVFSAVLDSPKGYFAYFAISYSIWTTLSRTLSESSSLWVSSQKYIKQFSAPISLFIYKAVFKLFIIFMMSLPIGWLIALLTGAEISPEALWVIPGIIVYFSNIIWIVTVLSIVSLRYRDIAKFMPNLVFLIYLTTPILWSVDRLGDDKMWIALFNPIYHMLSLVRDPLLGMAPSSISWIVCISMAVIGNIVAIWALRTYRWKIHLWL